MGRVAVIHTQFSSGGGEAVCMSVIEALQDCHDVHLFSLHRPDIEALNEQFGTAADPTSVNDHRRTFELLERTNGLLNGVTGDLFGVQFPLKASIHGRLISGALDEFDLRISTMCELPLRPPAVQYVHYPFFNRHRTGSYFSTDGVGAHYQSLVTRMAGATPKRILRSETLTNSEWSASEFERLYGARPSVIYPPVGVDEFENLPWRDRESGFVMIGRISSDKRVHDAIDIVQAVHERGHDTHLHLVGPADGRTEGYCARIRERAHELPFVRLEGKVPRERLVELIESHKWGIHAKPYEHFGIAVAELLAGGVVPFVPDSGGQTSIVGGDPRVTYSDTADAVEKICRCLEDQKRAEEIRDSLPDAERFGGERFEREIRDVVDRLLE